MQCINVDALMSILVGFHVRDLIERVSFARFHTVERDAPNLQLILYLVEDDRVDVAGQEKRKSQDEKEDNHQILPPMATKVKNGIFDNTLVLVLCREPQNSLEPMCKEGR